MKVTVMCAYWHSVGDEQPSKAARNQNKHSKGRNAKREHSPPSEDDARKKTDLDVNQTE